MKSFNSSCLFSVLALLVTVSTNADEPSVNSQQFGTFEGQPVMLFTLTNQNGMVAQITDYGGVVVSLKTPNRDGKFENVVLGFSDFASYKNDEGYFGAIVGRCANRIANGKFSLEGKDYQLATNNGPNHFHGGHRGFNKRHWKPTPSMQDGQPQLKLEYHSPDGEEGYPGNLHVANTYTITNANALKIEYRATTDQPTLCNLIHHSYWNLGGPSSDTILDHELQFHCDKFLPTDKNAIPTGELRNAKGTPFDFLEPHRIGERIEAEDEQISIGRGYDHNFVINGKRGNLRPVARVHDKKSGRVMELLTTDVGVQFYSGNFFDGSVVGSKGKPFSHRIAFCLECQRFPNSPNEPEFPSATLRPGEVYEKTTVYRFSTQ